MATHFSVRYSSHPQDVKNYDTATLREHFAVEKIFVKDEINLVYSHFDRFMVSGAFPVSKALALETIDPIRSSYFTERREVGIVNVGGKGKIIVNAEIFELDYKEALYIGHGNKVIAFESLSEKEPAKFYINSAIAHTKFLYKKGSKAQAQIIELGAGETANHRIIKILIVQSLLPTCQLQKGITELKTGSVMEYHATSCSRAQNGNLFLC